MYPVNLTGMKVALREFRGTDEDGLYALNSDDRVTRWLSYDSRTREQTRTALTGILDRARQEPRTEYYLAFSLPGSDQVIGAARLGLTGVKAAKLGFLVHADRWGKGYATDAARAMITFGFRDLDLHRISAAIGPENAGSIAVVERLGFQLEGRLRDHVFTNGAWRDSILYSLLTTEWPAVTH